MSQFYSSCVAARGPFGSKLHLISAQKMNQLELVEECVQAIRDGTPFSTANFIFHTSFDICERCATLGIPYEQIPQEVQRKSAYAIGCVVIDDLQKYLEHQPSSEYLPLILACAGKHCSQRVMMHHGISEQTLPFYIEGAISARNKDTLSFLLPWKYVHESWHYLLRSDDKRFSFVVDCYREGLLSLSEGALTQLKARTPELYHFLMK